MMKKVRLTPELEKKYREWLRAQHGDGLTYDTSAEGEVRERPTSAGQREDIERWMRETNVTDVEFEEEEYGDEEDNPSETPASPPAPDMLSRLMNWWRGN